MAPQFLLDTDIFIYIRRNKPEVVSRRFRGLRPDEAAISVITYGELLYGANKSGNRTDALRRLREIVDTLPILPLPQGAGDAYGEVRADLESKGEMIGNNDLWIAAHALESGMILVTNNEKEFRRVRGLKVQNWTV